MIVKSTDGVDLLGIWPTGILGTVRITTYGNITATYNAAELINAIQKESK